MDIQAHIRNTPGWLENLSGLSEQPLPAPQLISAKIKLLWQCNLSCLFCELPAPQTPMSLAQVETILVVLKALDTHKIHYSGGEVCLHPEFETILSHSVQSGFQVNLTTNGTLLDKDRVRHWVETGVHSVSLSIDGSTPKTHDRLRGQSGAFKATLKGLHLLAQHVDKGPKLRVNTVVSRENAHDLPALHDLLGQISDRIHWHLIMIHGTEPQWLLSKSMIRTLFAQAADWTLLENEDLKQPLNSRRLKSMAQGLYGVGGKRCLHCYMPWVHVFIDPLGFVYPCCRSRGQMAALGNIFETDLSSILGGQRSQAIRMGMATGQPMAICHYCDDFLHDNERIDELVRLRSNEI